jgi:thiosulfate/3-mercaptopyruvate sulfurtransferase
MTDIAAASGRYTFFMFDTLIETEVLAAHRGDPNWVVFDCRSVLTDTDAGPRAYAAGHIPGARYLHLEHDLSGPITPQTGRHPLPEPEALAAKFGRAGVGKDTQVVAYDDSGGAYAARLWWLLRWLHHPQVAVLNGGWQQWQKEGHAVETQVREPVPQRFPYQGPDRGLWLSTDQVLQMVHGQRKGLLLDARGPTRFRGEEESIDPVAGHVPGAKNLPFADNLAADGRFNAPAVLRHRFEEVLGGHRPEQAVLMCGSGVTACHDLLAMELAGMKEAKLYPGSWSEWIRDPARPVAREGA